MTDRRKEPRARLEQNIAEFTCARPRLVHVFTRLEVVLVRDESIEEGVATLTAVVCGVVSFGAGERARNLVIPTSIQLMALDAHPSSTLRAFALAEMHRILADLEYRRAPLVDITFVDELGIERAFLAFELAPAPPPAKQALDETVDRKRAHGDGE